jgi:hypothetical protein
LTATIDLQPATPVAGCSRLWACDDPRCGIAAGEFATANRSSGRNSWLTFNISAATMAPATRPTVKQALSKLDVGGTARLVRGLAFCYHGLPIRPGDQMV